MSTYPNLNNDLELPKIKTRNAEIEELKYKAEKHDQEKILKSLKVDNENYKKNYESSKNRKSY